MIHLGRNAHRHRDYRYLGSSPRPQISLSPRKSKRCRKKKRTPTSGKCSHDFWTWYGFFPRTWGSVASLSWQLLGTYLKQMPKDPRAQTNIFWCSGTNTSDGEYYYSPMKKARIDGGSFALISVVEQMSMANYVNKSPFTCPASSTSESRTLSDQLCVRIETTTLSWWATNCQYNPNSPSTNQLLLILVN